MLISEVSQTAFLAELDALLAVYTAAMQPEPAYLPGRLSIMERHAGHPGFRAIAATAGTQIVGFSYGFRGAPGQWWHDVVRSGITAASGHEVAARWLTDPLEIAEVHVRPEYQHQGIGRTMVLMLAARRTERTAVLSTQDVDSPARRLYRSLGFADLLTRFIFPGGGPPYAVMGAVLPLIGADRGQNQNQNQNQSQNRAG